jgi:cytoskeletal protein CcmA (bactofilin family)
MLTESRPLTINQQNFSFFGKGSKLNGTFHLKGQTFIACSIEGNLFLDDDSDLTIELSGSVKGNLDVHNLKVYGHIDGIIRSSGKVILYPGSSVEGEVTAENLVIQPGATANFKAHTLK